MNETRFPMQQLVDVNQEGTMLWPGSHLERTRGEAYFAAIRRSGSLEDDAIAMAEMEVPACPAGGMLIFDFRLLHRGMPNSTPRERPLAHAILSTGLAWDRLNSPRAQSLRAVLAAEPSEPEEHNAWRDAVARQQREAWQVTRMQSAS